MPDGSDSVEVNHIINSRALGRPSQTGIAENLGPNVPSRAVSTAVPFVGANDDGPGGVPSPEFNDDQKKASRDCVFSWGRGGEIEISAGLQDTPAVPVGAGISGMGAHLVATPPNNFGRPVRPDADLSAGNWNMSGIDRNTKIGG